MNEEKYLYCNYCGNYKFVELQIHESSIRHQKNVLLYKWNYSRKKISEDRNGVRIRGKCNLDRKSYVNKENVHVVRVDLKNFISLIEGFSYDFQIINENVDPCDLYLVNVIFLHPFEHFLFDGVPKYPARVTNNALLITVKYTNTTNSSYGSLKIPIAFMFQKVEKVFTIIREILITITDNKEELKSKTKTKSPYTCKQLDVDVVIPPVNGDHFNRTEHEIPKKYIPIFISKLISEDKKHRDLLEEINQIIGTGRPTAENYVHFFKLALWLEEVFNRLQLMSYNMEKVKMYPCFGNNLELEVPGLGEKRPSILTGDLIKIRSHNDKTAYTGVIECIKEESVIIGKLDTSFDVIMLTSDFNKKLFDVEFILHRVPYIRMHEGLNRCQNKKEILFPNVDLVEKVVETKFKLNQKDLINKSIYKNKEQMKVVVNILNGTSLTAPFIVFGPPGTGKSVTVIEAMLQIKRLISGCKILVCAPSNSTCDMLTQKLKNHCSKQELIRVCSKYRNVNLIPEDIWEYCNLSKGEFLPVRALNLPEYSIVVCTLISAGRLHSFYVPDYVFIDEAAQATEPEACVALSLTQNNPQIILSGDHKQLGPVCLSDLAQKKFGLHIPLFQRLLDSRKELYYEKEECENTNFAVMLKLNYRSHPDILKLPSLLFYNDELKAMSKKALSDDLSKTFVFPALHKKKSLVKDSSFDKASIEFCSVISKERKEGNSPSYFNESEMELVVRFVHYLCSKLEVSQNDIGIIAPYIRQVYRIKERLKIKYEGVEVGSVESFQGREKRVIIITTVRAQHSLLNYDKKYQLGFVKNEKRFNVALTRAMSKLIVIGCVRVLNTDSNWEKLIERCRECDAFFGTEAPKPGRQESVKIVELFNSSRVKDEIRIVEELNAYTNPENLPGAKFANRYGIVDMNSCIIRAIKEKELINDRKLESKKKKNK